MAVGADHGAVQADLRGLHRRHRFQFSRGEIILRDAVLLVQKLHHSQLHPVGAFIVSDGLAAQQQIQLFAHDSLSQRLLALLLTQMGQQVRDDQLGIAFIAADVHCDSGAIRQRHHAVKLHRDGHPLIFADAAVVVGLEIGQLIVLIQRVGLQIQPGRVDVGGGDLGPLAHGLAADMGQQHALPPVANIHLVSGLQCLSPDQGLVSGLLCEADCLRRAETLGLACIQKRHIFLAVGFHLLQLRRVHTVKAVFTAAQQLFLQCFVAIRHSILLRDCR